MRHRVAIGFGLVTLLAAATAQAADKPACKPAPLGTAQVRSVLDGRTVQLTDGREVRLAGIEVPQNAKAALETLVSGRDIALLRLGAESDRYGRVVALVSVELAAPDIALTVQRALLGQGQARVTAISGFRLCGQPVRGRTDGAGGRSWPLGRPVLCHPPCRGSGRDPRGSGSFRGG